MSASGTERARSLARTEAKTRAARFFARAQDLADELGLALVQLPESGPRRGDLEAGATALESSAAACVSWARASADGVIDAQEGAEVEAKASTAIAGLLVIRELARAAIRGRVVSLRRAGGV